MSHDVLPFRLTDVHSPVLKRTTLLLYIYLFLSSRKRLECFPECWTILALWKHPSRIVPFQQYFSKHGTPLSMGRMISKLEWETYSIESLLQFSQCEESSAIEELQWKRMKTHLKIHDFERCSHLNSSRSPGRSIGPISSAVMNSVHFRASEWITYYSYPSLCFSAFVFSHFYPRFCVNSANINNYKIRISSFSIPSFPSSIKPLDSMENEESEVSDILLCARYHSWVICDETALFEVCSSLAPLTLPPSLFPWLTCLAYRKGILIVRSVPTNQPDNFFIPAKLRNFCLQCQSNIWQNTLLWLHIFTDLCVI